MLPNLFIQNLWGSRPPKNGIVPLLPLGCIQSLPWKCKIFLNTVLNTGQFTICYFVLTFGLRGKWWVQSWNRHRRQRRCRIWRCGGGFGGRRIIYWVRFGLKILDKSLFCAKPNQCLLKWHNLSCWSICQSKVVQIVCNYFFLVRCLQKNWLGFCILTLLAPSSLGGGVHDLVPGLQTLADPWDEGAHPGVHGDTVGCTGGKLDYISKIPKKRKFILWSSMGVLAPSP